MEREAGSSSPTLRRAMSALELEELESRGDFPLLEEAPSVHVASIPRPPSPLLPTARPPLPPITPPTWKPPFLRQESKSARSYYRRRRRTLKGPLRVLRLCLLAVMLPALLVAGPLYLRYHVYADQVYPLAMSDMRLLDGRVSTTWCQSQVVRANATFNAFLLPEQPRVAPETKVVSMERELRLDDDMKEYWAFYLLRGSAITVSACVTSPGASLIVIRGHKHLHDCAYIGDNSSEEMDDEEDAAARAAEEAADAARRRADAARAGRARGPSGEPASNEPAVVRRARPGVELLGAHAPLDSQEILAHAHAHDPETDDALSILNKVAQKRAGLGRRRGGGSTEFQRAQPAQKQPFAQRGGAAPGAGVPVGAAPSSSEIFEEVLRKLRELGERGDDVLVKLNNQLHGAVNPSQAAVAATIATGTSSTASTPTSSAATATAARSAPSASFETDAVSADRNDTSRVDDISRAANVSNLASVSNVTGSIDPAESPVSPRAAAPGADSASLDDSDTSEDSSDNRETLAEALEQPGAMDALRDLVRKLLKEHAAEAGMPSPLPGARHRRASPPPLPGPAAFHFHSPHSAEARSAARGWSADDEEDNVAMEVDLQPDGIADHHVRLNETEGGDLDSSNSEFWSSFSSSEEALLSCTGLVLNLPLHPHHKCSPDASSSHMRTASSRNTLTYRVPTNGYYFFVFGSENEVQTNYIRAHFHLDRVVYNVSSPVASCHNTTEQCALPLDFFSSEKLVLEMPVRPNTSLWNEEFLVVSSCEPRTALYVICVLAVPILILLFAFQ